MSATMSLLWIIYFLLAAIAMLILVPQRDIVRLLPFGLVGGFGIAAIVQMIAVWYMRLWRFNYTELASYRGIPIFIALSWMPLTIIFGRWLLAIRSGTGRFFYIAAFALATVGLEWGLLLAGYLVHRNWNIFYTAILALVLHYLLAWYLLAVRPRTGSGKIVPLEK